jgi:hypothetical protein
LATAAREVGYATKPILLFYALAQGYRAACAAQLKDRWERSGHGLAFRDADGSVIDSVVQPQRKGKRDLYHGAAEIAEEDPLVDAVSIGELLASIAELRGYEIPGDRARPLVLRPLYNPNTLNDRDAEAPPGGLLVLVDGLPKTVDGDLEQLQNEISAYPTLADGAPATYPTGVPAGVLSEEEGRGGAAYRRTTWPPTMFPVFRFPFEGKTVGDWIESYEKLAPGHIEGQELVRVVAPGVGPRSQVLRPLTAWWALLLGLSSLARYHPSQWRQALDIDREPLAPALERLLDRAEESIPHYVYQGLIGGG